MPQENRFYINILIFVLFLAAVLLPVFILIQKRSDIGTPATSDDMTEDEFVTSESVYELFEGSGGSSGDLEQYFVDDPFRDTCSSAEGAVSSNTVCIR